jgi:hypothetical protein
MSGEAPKREDTEAPRRVTWTRWLLALLLALLALAYSAGVLTGFLPPERRLDLAHLAFLVLVLLLILLLLRPDLVGRVKLPEGEGWKVEMLQRAQARQEAELKDISLLLPLLLPDPEQKHLLNLRNGTTAGYRGNDFLREELRRLRSIGLIAVRGDHRVGEIKDGSEVDLAAFVRLTPLGETWVNRIKEMEVAEGP